MATGRLEVLERGEDAAEEIEDMESVEDVSEKRDDEVVDSVSDSESESLASTSVWERQEVGSAIDFLGVSAEVLRVRTESSIARNFSAIGDSHSVLVWILVEVAGASLGSVDQTVTTSPVSPMRTFKLFSMTQT